MQTKIYFANSVPAALEAARAELGADALLVNSRPAPPAGRPFGRLEVTFAWDPPPATRRAPGRENGATSILAGKLCDAGFERESAHEIAATADSEGAVMRDLQARIPTTAFAEMQPGEGRMLAFVGPPGRGKTTSLVKIAVTLGLARQIPVRIYTVGAQPIGAQEQMARFAAILGVPHQSFESLESLGLALNGDSAWRGLSLIDTPGISPSDRNELRDFGRFFAARGEIETHLVLRADARSADSLHMIARFAEFKVSRLLFTGTDETPSVGGMIDTLIHGGIPATFLGTGPQIPDDLEELDAARLARSLWTANAARQRFALAAA